MNNLVAGIGDVLLRYPELTESLGKADGEVLSALPESYVALHLDASHDTKEPPDPLKLYHRLLGAVPVVLIGKPRFCGAGLEPQKLRLHIEVVRRARKFIGVLSCFNVVAQIARVPSFVLVNRSIQEPHVYGLMHRNGAHIEAWNVGKTFDVICDEAVEWAR